MAAERPAGAWVPPTPVVEPANPHLVKPPEARVSSTDVAWSSLGSPTYEPVDYYGPEGEQG
jgi:hypothetical protein